jgi:hypothetical protein
MEKIMELQITEEIIEQKSLSLYEKATSLVIRDQDSYVAAGEVGKALKSLEKEIVDFFEPMRIAAKNSYDAVLSKKNAELGPVTEAMGIVRNTMNVFAREQERIRQEEEKKLQAKAEEDARIEREKLARQAEAAIDKGKVEKAEEIMERHENVYVAPVAVAPVIAKTVATGSGNITQAKEIKITVTNMIQFLTELIATNPGAVSNIVKIGDGPLKAFVKSNGIDKFAGLHIEKTVGVRL